MFDPVILAEGTKLFGEVGFAILGTMVGISLVVFGAAWAISRIASNAVESIARQPEAGGRIFTTMLISAALIEGFTFFGLVVCMLVVNNLGKFIETMAK